MVHREDLKLDHRVSVEIFVAKNTNILQFLTNEIMKRFGRPPLRERRIVGIGGAGCLGKSTLAESLVGVLRKVGYNCDWLELDGYLLEKAQREASSPIISGYNPQGYELRKIRDQLEFWLSTGEAFEVKVYDKLTSKRNIHRIVDARELLVAEGASAFYEGVETLISFKVFLNATKEVQYKNRWQREKTMLGYTDSQIEERFKLLYHDYEKYIFPTMSMADVVLNVQLGYRLSLDSIRSSASRQNTASCSADSV